MTGFVARGPLLQEYGIDFSRALAWNRTSSEDKYQQRRHFLEWRANTFSTSVIRLSVNLCWSALLFLSFRVLTDVADGNLSVIFPPSLESERDGHRMTFLFARRRRLALEASMMFGPVFAGLSAAAFPSWLAGVVFLLLLGSCCVVVHFLVGLWIQINNVKSLSMALAECRTAQHFSRWKEDLYKPTVSLLQAPNRAMSPMLCALLASLFTGVFSP